MSKYVLCSSSLQTHTGKGCVKSKSERYEVFMEVGGESSERQKIFEEEILKTQFMKLITNPVIN